MKSVICAVALLFSSVAPVAKAMGKYEPDTCKVQIFEITSSSSAQINEEDPDEPDFEPYDADSYNAPGEGEEEIALLNFDLPQGCVADLAQLELFTTMAREPGRQPGLGVHFTNERHDAEQLGLRDVHERQAGRTPEARRGRRQLSLRLALASSPAPFALPTDVPPIRALSSAPA